MAPFKDKWVRRFVINETTRHKQGFTIYKVTSMIFLKSSPDTVSKVSVWKRYNDFKKLHADLKILHSTLRIKEAYPNFSKPKFFGRFEADVIEERRNCAVKFLEFVARHSSLFTNDIFVIFFETSLNDGGKSVGDCSQSISSDTSEDDKSTIAENSDDTPCIEYNWVDLTKNLTSNSISRVIKSNNTIQERVKPFIVNGNSLDSNNDDKNLDEESQILINNNNVDKNCADTNWQQFLSVEKLLENGRKNDVSRNCENSPDLRDDCSLISDNVQDSGRYILIAAAHISAGFRHEAIAEYEEAFMQYKLGISNLRNGVQKDLDCVRTSTINDKIMKYSERAERLYNRHLNCNISMISKPVSELRYYKVLRVIGSVMLVNDLQRQITRVIKTVEKPAVIQEDISKYILRGKVPYMVQLHACIQTETTVFLILQYASGGKLWDFLKTKYPIPRGKVTSRKKSHARSTSCEAIIQLGSQRRMNTSLERSSHAKTTDMSEKTTISPAALDAKELPGNSKNLDTTAESSVETVNEELVSNIMYNNDTTTTGLLEKAQKLLKSVDATIKRSNSVASRLNESGNLLYETKSTNGDKETNEESENTEESGDPSELSTSDSSTDFSTESDKMIHDVVDDITKITIIPQLSTLENHDISRTNRTFDLIAPFVNETNERSFHDEDSGIEMEQELWRIPEIIIKSWAAQLLLTLEALHQQEVVISDLRPDNLLLDMNERILTSYVVPRHCPQLSNYQKPYAAPELSLYLPNVAATPASDVWSFGVILYELFTGIPFQSRHTGPFHSHSIISIPNELSESAKLLLTSILRFDPVERLTIPEIKQLSFFENTDWLSLLNA